MPVKMGGGDPFQGPHPLLLFFRTVMQSHFVARILGLKKNVLE